MLPSKLTYSASLGWPFPRAAVKYLLYQGAGAPPPYLSPVNSVFVGLFITGFFPLSPHCYALSYIHFPRGTSFLAEDLSSALWWLCWHLLEPGQALSPQQRPALQPPCNANTWIPTPGSLGIEGCFLLEEDSTHCICHGALSLSLIANKEGSEIPILPFILT